MAIVTRKVLELNNLGNIQDGDTVVGTRGGETGRVTYGGGIPGGGDTQLQYNNSGSFGGITTLTFNGTRVISTAGIEINGTVDEVQLKLRGHSVQSDKIFEIENNAASTLFDIDNSGNVALTGTVDGRDVAADGTKLDTIETGATGDQTDEEIQDAAWAVLPGGTQSGITVTYQDATNVVDFIVSETTYAGDSGSVGITPGGTFTIAGGTEIVTSVAGTTLTINSQFTPSSTDTLTNKTFDANGTGNSLSNVDVADLANGTDGELITWDAAGAPTTVAVGTAGQVLTSNGAGAAPTFADAAGGGGRIFLASATASNSASLDFTTGIDSTYDLYVFEIVNILPTSASTQLEMRTSTDGGSTFDSGASDYDDSGSRVATSGTSVGYGTNGRDSIRINSDAGLGNGADDSINITLRLYDPSDSAKETHVLYSGNSNFSTGISIHHVGGGKRNSAGDVDAVQFLMGSGNISSGTIRMYGIINA